MLDSPAKTQPGNPPSQVGDAFEIHRQMVIALFVATVFICGILGVGIALTSHVTVLMAVAGAGALGGFVSALRRVYTFQRVFPVNFFTSWRKVNFYLVVYSMIPSLVGTIAAVTLYVVFASGLMTGEIFPKFAWAAGSVRTNNFHDFVWNWAPADAVDYGKALVWGFIAGFSERFVPDLLTRLASTEQEKEAANDDANDATKEVPALGAD